MIDSSLDNLFRRVKQYRSSEHFKDMMHFCSRFKHLAPYNAMLLRMQLPDSKYVLREDEWEKKFNRGIKPNARPLIILIPFGPVSFVFDISDTYQLETQKSLFKTNEEILEEIEAPFKTRNEVNDDLFKILLSNLTYYGILYDPRFRAASSYGAQIELLEKKYKDLRVELNRNQYLKYKPYYLLSTNSNAEQGQQFASILHELAHLFCFHLVPPKGERWWNCRSIDYNAKEFEAESVSWLICERLNVGNPSEKYLSNYLDKNSEIPNQISVDQIFSAANEIWKMLRPLNYKDGLLYKKDKCFKQLTKQVLHDEVNRNEPNLFD